jgi:hypothetical protein
MKIYVMLAVGAAVAGIAYGAITAFVGRPSNPNSTAAVNTLAPHEIHLNYKAMKTLPVHDVKDAF